MVTPRDKGFVRTPHGESGILKQAANKHTRSTTRIFSTILRVHSTTHEDKQNVIQQTSSLTDPISHQKSKPVTERASKQHRQTNIRVPFILIFNFPPSLGFWMTLDRTRAHRAPADQPDGVLQQPLPRGRGGQHRRHDPHGGLAGGGVRLGRGRGPMSTGHCRTQPVGGCGRCVG